MSPRLKWPIFFAVTVLFLLPAYLLVWEKHWLWTGGVLSVATGIIFALFGRPNPRD